MKIKDSTTRIGAHHYGDGKDDVRRDHQKDAILRRATRLAREVFDFPTLNAMQRQSLKYFYERKNMLVVAPTGGGKSLCYILPSLLTGERVLVISPLISLIRDQAQKLRDLGIVCASIDSGMDREARENALDEFKDGLTRILFVSPERLAKTSFRHALKESGITLIAVDEAHCISHWGYDFRPEYRKIGTYLADFPKAKIMALTATAPIQVREEIRKYLNIPNAKEIYTGPLRENLEIDVCILSSQALLLDKLVTDVMERNGSGIVYVPTKKKATELANELSKHDISFDVYHSGRSMEERQKAQDSFLANEIDVIIATNSFGMGIDKPDVEFVHHYGMPGNIENYLQEIGRAGRNGMPAFCHLYYGPKDFFIQNFMFKKSLPEMETLQLVFRLANENLKNRFGMTERELLGSVGENAKLKKDVIEACLTYLTKEGILTELRDQNGSTLITSSDEASPVPENFWLKYHENRDHRKKRLRAMYDYVKCKGSRSAYLESYFSV